MHAVETMAFAHEVPWHGLGTQVPANISVDEMLVAAGLNWEVQEQKLTTEAGILVPGHKALVRSSDNKILDIVSEQWKPVQNKTIFEFFKQFAEAGNATMETAGSLKGGAVVWGLMNLGTGWKMNGGDEVRAYLLMTGSHKSGRATVGKNTAIRVVCANTMAIAMSEEGTEYRVHHRKDFDIAAAVETIGIAREEMSEYEKNCRLLKSLNISQDDVIRILAPVYQPEGKGEPPVEELVKDNDKLNRPMLSLIGAYHDAPGADPGTGWGCLNAVTYFTDHERGRSNETRLNSSWLGSGARRKQAVFDSLLQMAA